MNSYKVLTFEGSSPDLEPYLGTIFANWLNTLRYTNDWFKLIEENVYYGTYKKVIRALLDRPGCMVNVAWMPDTIDTCPGWAVYEPGVLHYCFVQRDGRNEGVGTALVPSDIHTITHLTVAGTVIWKTKHPHWKFNPFL